jgi:acyl-homoserine lactone acylase PvdQ
VQENSAGCYLFHQFLRTLTTNVFADDFKATGQSVNGLLAIKALLRMLTSSNHEGTTFCDPLPVTVTAPQTCIPDVVKALVQAVRTLGGTPSTWVWGRVHTIQPVSLLQLVTTNFQPGPYARPGGAFTVDVGTPSVSASAPNFAYTSGGNVRHISLMDPTKPVTKMQLPGPERDVPTTLKGPDLLGQWVSNTYFDFAIGSQIDAAAVSTQSFSAAVQ